MFGTFILNAADQASKSAVSSGDPLIDFLANNASAAAIMAFVIVALMRGWLVTGRELKTCVDSQARAIAERDRALDLVYRQAEATHRALDVAEKVKSL